MSDLIHYHIKGSGKPLVLIHGWAMHAAVWQGVVDQLAEHCMTVALDLRGHGDSRALAGPYTFEQYARDVIAVIEHLGLRDAALLGWSMGASVILKMFAQGYCGKGALIFVSGNPSLVQRVGYESALAPAIVERLYRQVQRDYPRGLSTFLNLLCTPQEHERFKADPAYRAAMDITRCPDREAALAALACLQTEDLREQVARIRAPALVVHGERDAICLSGGGRYLSDHIPGAQMLMLPDTGHMPFITRRERVVEAVLSFFAEVSWQRPAPGQALPHADGTRSMIDKTFVKKSFNVGAATYDDNAGLQRRLLEALLDFADCEHMQPERVLDIGVGTGNLSARLARMFPGALVHGCDLAENMLTRARLKTAACTLQLFAADAEALPLRAASFDLAASSFTLQWLNSLDQAMREIMRILKPGGKFFFAAFGANTFQELRSCFLQACAETGYDQGEALVVPHTRARADQAMRESGFSGITTRAEQIVEYYGSVAELVRSIKGMGARNASPRRNRTPGVRRIWRRMVQLYEMRYGSQGRIPATFEVIRGRAVRPR